MLAFHNDVAVKNKYVERVNRHIIADNLIRGTGWEDGKGCAVGCTLEAYEHERYPIELGIPEWLARVEDTLFEGMTVEKSRTWPKDFLEAINVGADLEKIKPKFLVMVLKSALYNFDHDKFPEVKNCIDDSITLWQRDDIGSDSWELERSAAESAARSAAESAARPAIWSVAESAIWSAAQSAIWSAIWSSVAESAIWSAAQSAIWSAAQSAIWSAEKARTAKHDYFADELLQMLKECK